MSYPVVAYTVGSSSKRFLLLPEDPANREYGEAENNDALIWKSESQSGLSSDELIHIEPYDGTEPLIWLGFLNRLYQTDYLYNDLRWPLISKRMLYVLRSVGEFPFKAVSTRIYDYGFQNQGRNNDEGQNTVPSGEFNEDYVGLQLLEHIEGIDYEQTEFRPSLHPDILPPQVMNLVLKEPVGGFPPIFRLNRAGQRSSLFVSPTAKEALDEAGIKGLFFINCEGTRAQEASAAS
jgi:hypothetical protein